MFPFVPLRQYPHKRYWPAYLNLFILIKHPAYINIIYLFSANMQINVPKHPENYNRQHS